MTVRVWVSLVTGGALTLGALVVPTQATAMSSDRAHKSGTARVTIKTPQGVPANVVLSGKATRFAVKPSSGKLGKANVALAPGHYRIKPQSVTIGGRLFTGKATPSTVDIRSKKTVPVRVTYKAEATARSLHATKISQSTISLSWTAPKRATFSLRRTVGAIPASTRLQGRTVKTQDRTAIDKGLAANSKYAYALFTKLHGTWSKAVSASASTAAPAGSKTAAYVTAPTTLLATAANIDRAAATGSGVRVVLDARTLPPVTGAAVVLPRSTSLPGGYLGKVTTVSADGRTIELVAAGISDAFDYYEINVPSFSSGDVPLTAAATNGFQGAGRTLSSTLSNCLGGSADLEVTYSPSMKLGGHFSGKIDKYQFFGAAIPTGASLDMELTATATGAMAVKSSSSLKCALPFKPVLTTITTAPVPISFYFSPTAELSLGSALAVSNFGLSATAGVRFAGKLSLTNGASFSGAPILSASPLPANVTANGGIGVKLGGQVIVGPGAGTPSAGVIAGIGGELNPIDASFGPLFEFTDSRFNSCLRTEAAFSRELSLKAKAWLGDWDVSKSVTIDALKGSTPYFGSPWDAPSGCKNAPPVTPPAPPAPPQQPGDTVLGDGVTKVVDSTSGSPEQWGRVDGFIPGQSTWVLSTGRIVDALGSPDFEASTDLLLPGNDALSALAGNETQDAAAYTVTLVPSGSMLHVKFVFASEEYPEYVGTQYNDVMAVFINGVNCATVPGTSQPVAVNNVNAGANAAYFVDNSTGAAGYSSSMDGLTVPLTCSAPVTPGQQVTVQIGVADTSDGILDSAVALVDEGIWSN